MSSFGKKVRLEVYDNAGGVVLDATGLRVDFDIRLYQGYNRARFTIYNLSSKFINEVSNGERYVRMFVQLHDGPEVLLAEDYYVNNTYTEKKVPNSLTYLFCVDKLRKDFTSKQVSISLRRPSLKRYLEALKQELGINVNFTYTDFPPEVENYLPVRPLSTYSGEVDGALKKLGSEYNFTYHIKPNNTIDVVYRPLASNVHQTGQADRTKIVLDTKNMRSNPIIGLVQLQIETNLDPSIVCNSLLDTSQLITASVEEDQDYLAVTKDYIKSSVSGYSIFSTLSITHLGSTHTNKWSTKAIAIKAAKGSHIDMYNWFK